MLIMGNHIKYSPCVLGWGSEYVKLFTIKKRKKEEKKSHQGVDMERNRKD